MNGHGSLFLSSSSTVSTIRPRNRRLISYVDGNDSENLDTGVTSAHASSNIPSPFPSRAVSPLPSAHPSRSNSTNTRNKAASNRLSKNVQTNPISSSSSTTSYGLWESWSSLQGIASTLLGSDANSTLRGRANGVLQATSSRKPSKPSAPRTSVQRWGPGAESTSQPAAGSGEERQALVQAKKRDVLLLANAHEGRDSIGKYKRRDSNTNLSSSVPQGDHEEDALVYMHRVKAEDTMAGVMIKYSCSPAAFRKVNRFWPNDNIQIRTHVLLPVDACGIRGKKVENNLDLLASEHEKETSSFAEAASEPFPSSFELDGTSSPLSLMPSHNPLLYKHESWVRLASFSDPVEILRIPRRILGFFPPARRKSGTISISNDTCPENTPKTSLEVSRLHSASPASRARLLRSSSTTSSTGALAFAERLKGPGGVGTLHGYVTSTPIPGPAQDPLNKMFAHHLPNVAPRESFDSVHSNSSTGLENVSGAIEGWVRKLGGKVSAANSSGRGRMNDLIELEGSESGFGIDDDGQTPTATTPGPPSGKIAMRATEEALLRGSLPPRGRTKDAYPGMGKGKGKGD